MASCGSVRARGCAITRRLDRYGWTLPSRSSVARATVSPIPTTPSRSTSDWDRLFDAPWTENNWLELGRAGGPDRIVVRGAAAHRQHRERARLHCASDRTTHPGPRATRRYPWFV